MVTECLIFVSLVIALVWMILYCIYLKNRLRDAEKIMYRINAEQMETRRILRSLGKLLGYDLPCNLDWKKDDKK